MPPRVMRLQELGQVTTQEKEGTFSGSSKVVTLPHGCQGPLPRGSHLLHRHAAAIFTIPKYTVHRVPTNVLFGGYDLVRNKVPGSIALHWSMVCSSAITPLLLNSICPQGSESLVPVSTEKTLAVTTSLDSLACWFSQYMQISIGSTDPVAS